MFRSRLLSLAAPALATLSFVACTPDNTLHGKPDGSTEFEDGDDWEPPVDSDDTDDEEDSGEDTVVADYCDERIVGPAAVAQDSDCEGGPRQPDWDLEVLWEQQVGSATYSPAVVGQLDDDNSDGRVDDEDVPDIVVIDSGAVLWSRRGDDGRVNWQYAVTNTTNLLSAIGDIDGDGWPNIVTDSNYSVAAFDGDGSIVWIGPSSSTGKNKGSCGAVGMADLDGDGTPEAYVGSKIINGVTGSLRGNGTEGDGLGVGNTYGHSIAADLDDDGVSEIVVGNAAYDPDGNTIWSNNNSDGTVAVADLDNNGSPEVVSVTSTNVITMDAEGSVLWTFDLRGALGSTPVIADVDGDRYPDVIIPTTTVLYVIDRDGKEMHSINASGSGSGRGGASAYDLDGNGAWEIVWQSPSKLMIIDGTTGDVLTEYALVAPTCAGPVPIVDVDADGDADIVTYDAAGKLRVLTDTKGFTQARPVWHQSDYSLTNVEDNSEMPMGAEPNWKGENNFRAGASVDIVNSLYPVIRDVCSDECAYGSVWVWYSIANNGYYDVADILDLSFWGVTDAGTIKLGEASWSGNVQAATMTEGAFVELIDVPTPLYDIQIRIVGSNGEPYEDCDLSDDIGYWDPQVCL